LDVAAREPEVERPERVVPRPRGEILKAAQEHVPAHRLLAHRGIRVGDGAFAVLRGARSAEPPAHQASSTAFGRGARRLLGAGGREDARGRGPQSSAPTRHRYASAAISTPMKIRISTNGAQPPS